MADPPGTHLEHHEAGVLRGAQDRQGQPDLGVERARGGHRRPEVLQEGGDQVLGRGLARRSGDGHDAGGRQLVQHVAGQPTQGGHGVVGDDDRRLARGSGAERDHRPCAVGGGGEVMAVDPLPHDRDVEVPRARPPGVGDRTGDGERRVRAVDERASDGPGHRRDVHPDHANASIARRSSTPIVERGDHSSCLLSLLVSLAEHQHGVVRLGHPRRDPDGQGPVGLDQHLRPLPPIDSPRALHDGLPDGQGRLGAWVVVGDDQDVGTAGRDLTHGRALVPVAVPAAAEDRDHPPGDDLPGRPDGPGHRVRGVRVVDEGQERLAGGHPLHPARDAGAGPDGVCGQLRLDPVMDGGGQRGQRVGHVEASGQADSGSDVRAAGTHGRELRGPGGARAGCRAPSSRRAGPGHRSPAGSARPLGQAAAPLVVDADQARGGPLRGEQLRLGGEVRRPCRRGSPGGPG